jgi:hypothetical protein
MNVNNRLAKVQKKMLAVRASVRHYLTVDVS